MDTDTFTKLVTALTDWRTNSNPYVISEQPSFGVSPAAVDYVNKTFGHSTKPEPSGGADNAFSGNTNMVNNYQSNVLMSADSEQVPMDAYDPLESFTFWDGETFYCNQDLEATCGVSPNIPVESEMTELQDYLIREDVLTRDDLAQIDDSDLIRNPTLAELNSCNDALFDCSAESSFLSEDSGYLLSPELLSKSVPINECSNFLNPTTAVMSNSGSYVNSMNIPSANFPEPKSSCQSLLSSSCPVTSRALPCPQYFNVGDERLLLCPQNSPASDSFMPKHDVFSVERNLNLPGPSKPSFSSKRLRPVSALSASAPLEVSVPSNSPGIKAESPGSSCGSKSAEKSLSSFSALSLSNDDESGSYFDSDHDEEDDDDAFSSEDDLYQYESDETFSTSWPPAKDAKGQPRRNRYFWQYNLQSRGIKTQNLLPLSEETDPYVLNDVKDPVFSEDCTLPVKHSGKARKGDGNDLTPNPRKLFSIGLELKKLNKMIYNLNPAHDFSPHGKPLSRKEKNKLASRVCRLKKKAQHEANKIKLYGLQQEHKRLLTILFDLRRLMTYRIDHFQETKNMPCFQKVENYLMLHEPMKVAGNTTEFVNEVLEKVSKGDNDGGLGNL